MAVKQPDPIVGIDFGTSGSRVAALVKGKPTMLEGPGGESTMPADVLVREDGSFVVGQAARRHGPGEGAIVVHAAKRLLGRAWEDPAITDLRRELGSCLVRSATGLPAISFGDNELTASDICAQIFRQLRENSSRALGVEVSRAVLAVPADYGFIQRKALSAVAAEAGLEIVRIVSEPTAAALFRGQGAENRKIAVYDFGGGTFDISILDIGDGVYEVLAADGDPFLGGEDIDLRLLAHVLEQSALGAEELDQASMYALRTAVEALKRELSENASAVLSQPHLRTKLGQAAPIELTISRETLQNLCQDLIDRTLVICNRALLAVADGKSKQALTPSDIDDIVLVGGTTWLPFIEENVTRYFGRAPEKASRREDAVALGCAMYAGILTGEAKEPLLLDGLSRSYAVQIDDNPPVTLLVQHDFYPSLGRHTVPIPKSSPAEATIKILEVGSAAAWTVAETTYTPTRDARGRGKIEVVLTMDVGGELDLRIVDRVNLAHSDQRLEVNAATASTIATASIPQIPSPPAADQTAPAPLAASPRRRRILAVATEWSSGAGGLSTFNREFCLALSAAGHDVRCLVTSASAQEQSVALAGGVRIVEAVQTAGQTQEAALARKPAMEDDWTPEYVIGHGRITGPAAVAHASDHFPGAKRLHLIHMAPDEIEWFKLDRQDDAGDRAEERTKIERALGTTASHVVAVGPRLHDRYLTDFTGTERRPIRLDPGFDSSNVTPIAAPEGKPHRILLVGRAEDEELKGLDIAAAALGKLASRWTGDSFELNVRGAPAGQSQALHGKLLKWSKTPGLPAVVMPFSPSADELAADYKRASVVLMPSRREGFGLVGLEAICAGVPVLVSNHSGLAELLKQTLPAEDVARMVVPVTNDPKIDPDTWSHAIERILLDRNAAFDNAHRVRKLLSTSVTWAKAVADLFEAIDPS